MDLVESIRKDLPCSMVNNLTSNTEEQCKFMIDNHCLEDEAIIDYVRLVFCDIDLDMRWAAIILVLFLVLILFLNLSAVADECLCPNLLTVAKSLRMSDSLAGVTLLAFGNGCPDIFSSLAAASSGRPEILVGELLGAGIFCTSIVAGLIFIQSDFKLARRPLLRDATFYLLAVFLVWLFCFQGAVTFYGSLAFIIIYVIYLFVALVGQAVHSRMRGRYPIAEAIENDNERVNEGPKAETSQQEDLEFWLRWREESLRRGSLVKLPECCCKNRKNTLILADNSSTIKISYLDPCEKAKVENVDPVSVNKLDASSFKAGTLNADACRTSIQVPQGSPIPQEVSQPTQGTNVTLDNGKHFTMEELWDSLEQISPITGDEWSQVSLIGKAILILRSPLLLLTTLTVPVVNNEKRNNNWNRLLNSIHCITIPIAVILMLKLGFSDEEFHDEEEEAPFSGDYLESTSPENISTGEEFSSPWSSLANPVPIKYWLISPSFVLALFVFISTNNKKAPSYHAVFAYFGFAMSVMWIYKLANEIISILKTVGIIFSLSDTAIGLGVLAWGNSLGDIVANLTLAEAGYARMALGASIGAPLLNLLLGFGLSFCVSLKPGEAFPIEYSRTTALLAITLAIVLVLLMLSTLAPSNKSKKPFGYLLISCYGVYFALAVCFECDLI